MLFNLSAATFLELVSSSCTGIHNAVTGMKYWRKSKSQSNFATLTCMYIFHLLQGARETAIPEKPNCLPYLCLSFPCSTTQFNLFISFSVVLLHKVLVFMYATIEGI